jgi:hypothetical protein
MVYICRIMINYVSEDCRLYSMAKGVNMSDNCQFMCRMIVVFKFYISDECFEKKIGAFLRKRENVNGIILLLMKSI